MPHPARPDTAIIIPKIDEFDGALGVLAALGEENSPNLRTQFSVSP